MSEESGTPCRYSTGGSGPGVALAGGAGDDPWGSWLRDRLSDAGVDLRWFRLLPGIATPVAFVVIDPEGEPRYQIHGEGIEAIVGSAGPGLPEAVAASEA